MLKLPKWLIALSLLPQYIAVKIMAQHPDFVEEYYSRGLYPILSKIARYALGWLPFSVGDIVYTLAFLYALYWLIKNRKRLVRTPKSWCIDVCAAAAWLYFLFHLCWGINYYRLPLYKTLHLDPEYNTEQLVKLTEKLIQKTNKLQKQLTGNDSIKVRIPFSKHRLFINAPIGYEVLKTTHFNNLEYPPPSIKQSLFSYPLTYMGFSGYFNPLTNEAQVDALLPKYSFPTTTLHEMAHQLGYAAENEANFIGFMAAISHPDPYFKYCGYAFGLRFCLNELYRRDQTQFKIMRQQINLGILKNYQETRIFWDSYQNPLEPVFKVFYGHFLKANNQSKGLASYSYVVALMVNYFEEHAF